MKLIKIIAGLSLMLFALWGVGLAVFAGYALSIQPQAVNEKTDAIVVLTGGKGRIEEGLRLYAEGAAVQLFITGVHESVSMDEIRALWDGGRPLPACCITLGRKATSTVQNAQETREWLEGTGYKSIRLVTGNYHMPRAMLNFSQGVPDTEIIIHPVEQHDLAQNKVLLRRLLVSEYHKSLYRVFEIMLKIEREPKGGD